MKSIGYLGLIFILIIVLTSLLIKQVVEHFAKVDPIITKINTIKNAFKNMYKVLGERDLSDIVLKGVPLKSSVAVQKNIFSLGEFEKAYILKLNNTKDPVKRRKLLIDTKQEISAFMNTYNDINTQLSLELPSASSYTKNIRITKNIRKTKVGRKTKSTLKPKGTFKTKLANKTKIARKTNNVPKIKSARNIKSGRKRKSAQKYGKQFNNQLSMPSRKLNKTLAKQIKRQKPNYLNTKKPKTFANRKPRNLLKVNKRSARKGSARKSSRCKGSDNSIFERIRKNLKALFYTPYLN
jgi:hypothetical protein